MKILNWLRGHPKFIKNKLYINEEGTIIKFLGLEDLGKGSYITCNVILITDGAYQGWADIGNCGCREHNGLRNFNKEGWKLYENI